MPDPTSTPSGWFPDPLDRYDHRYFNGTSWTSDVSAGGQRYVDPLGTGPGHAAGGKGPTNGAATAAVVMGSVGVAIAWIPFIVVFGAVLAVLALVFGIIGIKRSRVSDVGRGASIAGIVMGSLGIAASVVGVLLSITVLREVIRFVEPGEARTEIISCSIDGRRAEVSGSITNLDDDAREYTLFVEVDDRTEFVTIDELDPGETAEWSTVVTVRSAGADCDPGITVQGPFPYGIEVDPVD
ncbi:MAG: DUF4190 domain-containing protein [Ilumatobacteraceae bacterium]|nr:DUF4190 domain-containing protein [Ilumatobacteraceae bacterium]